MQRKIDGGQERGGLYEYLFCPKSGALSEFSMTVEIVQKKKTKSCYLLTSSP